MTQKRPHPFPFSVEVRMLELFLLAALGGVLCAIVTDKTATIATLGFLAYVAWSVYNQFFVPHIPGGGASFWPIDIVFAGPCSASGAAAGHLAGQWLLQQRSAR